LREFSPTRYLEEPMIVVLKACDDVLMHGFADATFLLLPYPWRRMLELASIYALEFGMFGWPFVCDLNCWFLARAAWEDIW